MDGREGFTKTAGLEFMTAPARKTAKPVGHGTRNGTPQVSNCRVDLRLHACLDVNHTRANRRRFEQSKTFWVPANKHKIQLV